MGRGARGAGRDRAGDAGGAGERRGGRGDRRAEEGRMSQEEGRMTMSELRAQVVNLLQDAWELGYECGAKDNSSARTVWTPDAMTDAELAEHGLVELPKDAHGEYIRVGDTLDGYGKTIEVVEMRYGRSGWVLISRDGNGYADTFAFTHHHAPTVEDALREFAEKVIDSQIPGMHPTYEEAIAECAAKLRLADDSHDKIN